MTNYQRAPQLDKRIKNGDDFAGDAYVRWVAVGHTPDDAENDLLQAENDKLKQLLKAIVSRVEWKGNALGWSIRFDLPAGTIAAARSAVAKAV